MLLSRHKSVYIHDVVSLGRVKLSKHNYRFNSRSHELISCFDFVTVDNSTVSRVQTTPCISFLSGLELVLVLLGAISAIISTRYQTIPLVCFMCIAALVTLGESCLHTGFAI